MKTLVVGGNIGTGKKSSIVNQIGEYFNTPCILNGCLPKRLHGFDLTLWMPDISNEQPKDYPIKDIGSVLICSKVMREGYNHIDSVSRIFKMHGNAVIEIYKENDIFLFELRDALNHCWCRKTQYLPKLFSGIMNLYNWSKGQIRRSLKKQPDFQITDPEINIDIYYKFIQLNRRLADKVAEGCGNRFFGNYSTRCTKLFPSVRNSDFLFLFSPRNTDKKYVTTNDRVICDYNSYYGDLKPSVDTPVQLEIYHRFPEIDYMIHGHAYIDGAETTDNYFPCGDMREVNEIVKLLRSGKKVINLKNHGFLIVSETLDEMESYSDHYKFVSL